jgi:NAD-dependent dihydropyrimidine dehydrogenase PreA subunit
MSENMMQRMIISIDRSKCNGCGLCIPSCPEGALQIIDGKARLISDLFCDGLGACIGQCPEGAIEVIEREAEPYDEGKVMAVITPQGANTIKAHIEHLRSHGETALLSQALAYLEKEGIPAPATVPQASSGCPGMREVTPTHASVPRQAPGSPQTIPAESQLGNWPIQLHLLSPMAPQLAGKDVLLSADCVAHAVGDFHGKFLSGKALAIACPKLDQRKEIYREKIVALIDHARINTLTVAMMEVPCCQGLLAIAQDALSRAQRKIPLKAVIVGINGGETLEEKWI